MHSLVFSTLAALVLSRIDAVYGVALKERQLGGGPRTRDITMNVVNTRLAPDGFSRNMITVDGQYPGPLITANKGDSLSITVNNRLTDNTMRRSTAIDLDGVFKNTRDVEYEGSAFVTQCPIPPQSSFTYDIDLDPNQAGTFWYHSSLDVQYIDGLRGPLIIYDQDDPQKDLYDVDDETTIIQLGDFWHNTSLPLLASYEATGIIPVADSGTVNGRGRFNGGPATPFAVVPATPRLRHRLRIISESARSVFTFSIDNHTVDIIGVDGVATEPLTVSTIQILAGQRYDVILNANQPIGNYWINAPLVGGAPARNPNQNATLSRAILRYTGALPVEPNTPMTLGPDDPTLGLHEPELVPLVVDAPPDPDVELTFQLEVVAGRAIWNINNVSYVHPVVPTLVKILEGADSEADFNVTENTFVLPRNKTIQITFPANDDDDAHPFHLHGQNFWVVKSNSSEVINTVNPIKRDTAGAGADGMIIRFRTDNAGPWFFHCHIFWHFHAGLASVMATGLDETRAEVQPDADWNALCPAYNALPPDEQ